MRCPILQQLKRMNSQNDIIIVPTKPATKKTYQRIQEATAEELEQPPGMLSHRELARIKENAQQKKRATQKRKITLWLVLVASGVLLTVGLFYSVDLVDTNRTEIKKPTADANESVKNGQGSKGTLQKQPSTTPATPQVPPTTTENPPDFVFPAIHIIPQQNLPTPDIHDPNYQPPQQSKLPQKVDIVIPEKTGNMGDHRPVTEHSNHGSDKYPYPTLGMPVANTAFNMTEVGSGHEYYEYEKAMNSLFKPHNDTNCQLERYGDHGDGGYLLCKNLMNQSLGLINLGVQGRDLFGCGVSSAFLIPNYQYDCTNSFAPTCGTNQGLNRFESICLSDQTESVNGVTFFSLADMIRQRNLTGKHVSMKIDVEGAEWPGFRTFPVADLRWIDQMVLEIHYRGGGISHRQAWGNVDIIRSLEKEFVSVSLHMNNYACVGANQLQDKTRFYPSFAVEVTLVNKRIIKINKPTRSYALHPQDWANRNGPDCQLQD